MLLEALKGWGGVGGYKMTDDGKKLTNLESNI